MRPGAVIRSVVLFLIAPIAAAAEVKVATRAALEEALAGALAGTIIRLAGGDYGNGLRIEKRVGTEDRPIVITALDEFDPPVFRGGNQAIHFVECHHVTLRHVRVIGCRWNGINADDGGTYDSPSTGMVFENIVVEEIGPNGNHDGMKLSGLVDFAVRDCRIAGWGGSAIDMVGCRRGRIEGCFLEGRSGFSQASGIQAKGGTEDVVIRRNFFREAGHRTINLGGSTGLDFFRPEVRNFEARRITVEGNHFVGSMSPIAFATSVDCVVRRNTIVNPRKWVVRILQEQPVDRFLPCQGGRFERNLVVFNERVRTFVNVGPDTLPETFVFEGNAWFCCDADRRPTLPVEETGGIYQVDPRLEFPEEPEMRRHSDDPRLDGVGIQELEEL